MSTIASLSCKPWPRVLRMLAKAGLALMLMGSALGSVLALPVLSIVPQVTKLHPPQNFLVDVVVSGLHSGGTEHWLGGFDFVVLYDPTVLSFLSQGTDATPIGGGLGNPDDPLETLYHSDLAPGAFRLTGLSLLEASNSTCAFCVGPYLEDLQGDSFTLATLAFYNFSVDPSGRTTIGFFDDPFYRLPVLSDENGREIENLIVRNAVLPIPEPASAPLVVAGLLAALFVGQLGRVRHRLASMLAVGLLLAMASVSGHAGTVPPKDANFMVMQEVLVSDLAHLGALVGEDASKPVPWSGRFTDTGWTLTVVSAPYRNGVVNVQYVGTYDPARDMVSWNGSVNFTNAVGAVSWTSAGTYSDATKDGLWNWLKKAVKWVAHNEIFIDIIEYGAQTLATVASGGALGPAAAMTSNVIDRIQEGAALVHEGIESVEIIKGLLGVVDARAMRQGGPVPVTFREPGLVSPESPYIEVVSKALIEGNYANDAVTVQGKATVDTTICLTASFPITKDTFVRGIPAASQDANYGMQDYIAVGGGSVFGPGPSAFVQFDVPDFLLGHDPNRAFLALTVHSFEGGYAGAKHTIVASTDFGPWVEGNGYEGDPGLRPPGATDPISAIGVDWLTMPGWELEGTAWATVTQGTMKAGDVVRWDVTALVKEWLVNLKYGHNELNNGIRLDAGLTNAAARFGAREGKMYNLPGAVNGPALKMQWIGKGDFDGDGDIDRKDLERLVRMLGPVNDNNLAGDLDRDGVVSVLDARRLTRCCSRPNCTTE